jgi:TfoX/Sxy family transcriptional regulator of competence genes
MASKQRTVDFVVEQMSEANEVSSRKMFGEYAVYCRRKVVALVCDDRLFVKPTVAGRAFIGEIQEGFPYPGAKPWFVIDGERWEDRDWLSRLAKVTADELPLPRPPRAKAATRTKAKKVSPPRRRSARRAGR